MSFIKGDIAYTAHPNFDQTKVQVVKVHKGGEFYDVNDGEETFRVHKKHLIAEPAEELSAGVYDAQTGNRVEPEVAPTEIVGSKVEDIQRNEERELIERAVSYHSTKGAVRAAVLSRRLAERDKANRLLIDAIKYEDNWLFRPIVIMPAEIMGATLSVIGSLGIGALVYYAVNSWSSL